MFKMAVFNLKDIKKFFLRLIIIIGIIILIKNVFKSLNHKENELPESISSENTLKKTIDIADIVKASVDLELKEVKELNKEKIETNEEKTDDKKISIFNQMLKLGFTPINISEIDEINEKNNISKKDKNEDEDKDKEENEIKTEEKNNETKELELAKRGVKTEVITENPLPDTYNTKYKGVKIRNETDFELTDEVLNFEDLEIDKSNIVIFHTHTCESYTSSEKYSYEPTGNFRTTDLDYTVARVGKELEQYLEKYSIKVNHDTTYHDYPAYNGSYSRSLKTVNSILKEEKADIVIDLHRDAIGSQSDYAPTVKIGDDECAQIMFVMGSNLGGLYHPNWQNNLKFAVKLQKIANDLYPGLFKPIILRNSRYNQHVAKAACIMEVGATGNTLEQCLNSMKYLADIINEI